MYIRKRNKEGILAYMDYINDFFSYWNTFAIFKATNGRQKTCEIFHVYCIFYSGFMCKTTAVFGIAKDGSLVLNPLAS